MTRPIAYQPNSTSFFSKVVTAAPPTTAMKIAMAESTVVPAVSRSVCYKIQPITRPKKTAPRPVRNRSFLLGFPTGDEKARRTENLCVSHLSSVVRSRRTARLPMAVFIPMAGIIAVSWF